MNIDLIRNFDSDLLQELLIDLTNHLKSQRKVWLENEKSRTKHMQKLIKETRAELEFVKDLLKEKGNK